MDTLIGKSLQGGQYTLTELLGRGGFGITFKATHHFLQETYVIKTLNSDFRDDPQFPELVEKFRDEAKRLKVCEHPHIVRMRDFFVENGVPYLVMDYIPGRSLEQVVFPDQPLPEALAVHYIRQIGSALDLVHQKGLLHRDIKPENIILRDKTDQVVLIDFGIAREFVPGKTQAHTNLVTVGYAPVEQYMLKAKRSPATDVYALAATLYALVTARVPVASIMRDRQTMPEPRIINPRIGRALNQAILRGMAMEIEQRPASVREWMALLPPPSVASTQATNSVSGSGMSTAATVAVSPQSPRRNASIPAANSVARAKPPKPVATPAPSTAATLAISPPPPASAPKTIAAPPTPPATPPAPRSRGNGLVLLGLASLASMAIAAVGTVLYHSTQTAPPEATAPVDVTEAPAAPIEPEVVPSEEPASPEPEQPEESAFPPDIFDNADREDEPEDEPAETEEPIESERPQAPARPDRPSSTSATIRSVPGFSPGVTEQAVVDRLGDPAEVREDGSGLRTSIYVFPDQVDLVYIYDQQTDRLRQTEAYFVPYMDFNVMRIALNGMLQSGITPDIEQGLEAVRRGQAGSYPIETSNFEGVIEQTGDRIYVGIWERR
jgi:serine/threonine protein kinase